MVQVLNLSYESSDSVIAQGKDVSRLITQGYYKKQGGNGTYVMVKPSKVILEFEVDGERKTQSIKDMIRGYYSLFNISESRAKKFYEEIKAGKVTLEYSDSYGLYVA